MDRKDVQVLLNQMANTVEQQHRLQVQLLELWRALFAVEPDEQPRPAASGSPAADSPGGRATYTVAETAKMLGMSQNSTYTAIERGEIPSLRFGRRILVPEQALRAKLSGG